MEIKDFGSGHLPELLRMQFMTHRRQPGETLSELASDEEAGKAGPMQAHLSSAGGAQ